MRKRHVHPATRDPSATRDPDATIDPPESLDAGAVVTPGTASTLDAARTAATIRPSSDPPPPAATPRIPRFPIRDWDRYEPIRFLGQGGMGVVFLARDTVLQRDVAIKFVRGDDPVRMSRLVGEARAQARVNHENVCRVYEVGELDDQVFITMQFVDGEPLNQLASRIPVEQLALVMRDAALGIHEAHRAGIIHRDLKPSNILVSRREDGAWKPYVLDFGIAHEWDAGEGGTLTGTVMGTPLYMSPEQARGGVDGLDRRADVYSLGASLYQMLTRRAPIPGTHPLEVLGNIATVEPKPPRAVDPNIPADLEAITLKCLEKDRSARYESARALAEDLDRFLTGEPVLARPSGLLYRAGKRIRKNWRLYTAGAAVTALLLSALGWGLVTRMQASAREALVRRFTEQVEHVEATARYSQLSPLHDIRPDQESIRQAMTSLGVEIASSGAAGQGPGHYALGRGYLALGDEAKAREHLERAWQVGYRAPRVAYYLALVLGNAYQAQLVDAEKIRDAGQRERRKRELEQGLRAPALAYLRQSEGATVPSTDYVAALIAYHEDRYDDALDRLDRIGDGLRWFYEAPELRGRVYQARGTQRSRRGDREGALADFAAGREAFTRAAAVGESVPSVYKELGELEFAALSMELYGRGDVAPHFERGVAAVDRALVAQPDHVPSLTLASGFRRRMAEYRANRGEKWDVLMTRAVEYAERARAASQGRSQALLELARSWYQWSDFLQKEGLDPQEQLDKAIALLDTTPPGDRDSDYWLYAGLIHQVRADYLQESGKDPLPFLSKAIAAFQAAIAIDPRIVDSYINLGATYYRRAGLPRPLDADGDLQEAATVLDKARAVNAGNFVLFFEGGKVAIRRAERAHDRGDDSRDHLTRALELLEAGIAVSPTSSHLLGTRAEAIYLQGRFAWDRGEDPEPLFDRAAAAYREAIRAAPEVGHSWVNLGDMLAFRARCQIALGRDPLPSLRAAAESIAGGAERMPDQAFPQGYLSLVHAERARWEAESGRDSTASMAAAMAAAEAAMKINPAESVSLVARGTARGLRAQALARRRQARAADFDEAIADLTQGVEMAPQDETDYGMEEVRVHLYRAEWLSASGRSPAPSLAKGIELLDRVLQVRRDWPDARALRGRLLLAEARMLDKSASAAAAAREFAAALSKNRNLRRRYGDEAALAERLAAGSR